MLLHGFPQFWWAWRHQLVDLAERGYRVAAVDLRGYGDSDKPPRGYDLWTLAGDVAGLIRALGEPRADVVGHGWGGLIGWTVTALQPRLVRSLAVLGAPHPLALRRAVLRDPRGQGRAIGGLRAGFPAAALAGTVAAGATAGHAWSGSCGPGPARAGRRPRTSPTRSGGTGRRSAIPGRRCTARWSTTGGPCGRSCGPRAGASPRRWPARPAVPVLQVHGADDPWAFASTAEASARWAGQRHHVRLLGETGHFPHEERPDQVNRLLARFLAR